MHLKAFLELLRPLNCIMAAFGVFLGYSIAAGAIGINWQLLIAMLAAFLICGAGQAINDFFDAETDAKQHSKKPVPSKRISKQSALAFSIALFAIGNLLAMLLPLQSFLIAIGFSVILVLYSAKMQKLKFFGNWIVALGTAFTLVFGASLLQQYSVVFVLALSALLANVSREIIKDAEDLEADKGFKVSLPMAIKMPIVKALVLVFYLAAITLGFSAFFCLNFGNILFPIVLGIASLLFLNSSRLFFAGKYRESKNFSKIGMLAALISFLAGVL